MNKFILSPNLPIYKIKKLNTFNVTHCFAKYHDPLGNKAKSCGVLQASSYLFLGHNVAAICSVCDLPICTDKAIKGPLAGDV